MGEDAVLTFLCQLDYLTDLKPKALIETNILFAGALEVNWLVVNVFQHPSHNTST